MPGIPEFIESLEKLKKLHESKNEDYASEANPFFNFDFTANILKYFDDEKDLAFVWPIANKLGRLANLLSTGQAPNHESVQDSLDDIAAYALLWKIHIMKRPRASNAMEEAMDVSRDLDDLQRYSHPYKSK